ncbi:diguanylate cyclase [Cribrihabitans pelagius]|uniref:sensor domain-containing diguanylate cyclase n=1 Tax=Cribrihabitans pelagius TaxID=1765746 RepID=UPI003B5B1774
MNDFSASGSWPLPEGSGPAGPDAAAEPSSAPGSVPGGAAARAKDASAEDPAAKGKRLPPPEEARLRDILDKLEQGIIVWNAKGCCEMFNARLLTVLELQPGDIYTGLPRADFFSAAVARGDVTGASAAQGQADYASNKTAFTAHRYMPSGRILAIESRRLAGGGHVTSYRDVSQAQRDARELTEAKQKAEEAELTALKSLAAEQAWRKEARLLSELDEWLQCCKSLEELYQIVAAFMQQILPGSQGELYIYSNSRDVLDGVCSWSSRALRDHILPDSCWSLRRGRQYRYRMDAISFACAHVGQTGSSAPESEYVCVPIVAHGNTVGLMHVKFAPDTNPERSAAAHRLAMQCSEHISLAVANVKLRDELHHQSTRDPLTGLFNRRHFLNAIRSELTLTGRRMGQAALLSFDADRFKDFNDSHGHDAGDVVLRGIGDLLGELFRHGEICCRFGGEEFAVFLPDTDNEQALHAAEELRAAVSGLKLRYGAETLPRVTVSVGVAGYPEDANLPQDLLTAADRALYAAKDAGRNCVRDAAEGGSE